jgi:aspartate carbamoyltransferase catalytic subunit
MNNTLYHRSLISMKDLSMTEIEQLLILASDYKNNRVVQKPLLNKIIAHCFFEPSTRTRLSFESASLRLGGQNISFIDPERFSSQTKGETLQDSLKVISSYAEGMVIRHSCEGSARLAAEISGIPVINAGDGTNQHPTQTLLDLFSMQETQGRLKGLHVALVGDLKYARTAHSLVQAASLFDMRLYFVAPDQLALPEELSFDLKRKGIKFSFHQTLDAVIDKLDILYLTRLQKERFENMPHIEKAYRSMILTPELLDRAQKHMKILHPLPRQEELPFSIDQTPHAYYFQQAKNGLYVRQALFYAIFSDGSVK